MTCKMSYEMVIIVGNLKYTIEYLAMKTGQY